MRVLIGSSGAGRRLRSDLSTWSDLQKTRFKAQANVGLITVVACRSKGKPLVREPGLLSLGRQCERQRHVGLLDEPPGVRLLEDSRHKLRMESMAGTVSHEMTDDRMPDQREIANGIED